MVKKSSLMTDKLEITRGSGNVYQDFHRTDSDILQTKALLASEIIGVLDKRELSTRQASKITGIDHSEFVRIRKPDLKRFTIDRLITILNKLDKNVDVSVTITDHDYSEPVSL